MAIILSASFFVFLLFWFGATETAKAEQEETRYMQQYQSQQAEQQATQPNPRANINISCAKYKYPWCQDASQSPSPAGLIARFYQIALGLVGAAALGVLIYGAILWTLSGMVTAKQDALEWIKGAVWGVMLLLGAYLILHTINPNLVKLGEMEKAVRAVMSEVKTPQKPPEDTQMTRRVAKNLLPTPVINRPPSNLDSVNISTYGDRVNCKSASSCVVDRDLANRLIQLKRNFSSKEFSASWWITEAYPPTVSHASDCHKNATCVDTNFTDQKIKDDPVGNAKTIALYIEQADKVGLNAFYEVKSDAIRNGLIGGGVPAGNVRVVADITAPHFHVEKK